MTQKTWIICYDITDDKRRHKVFRILEGFGDRLQHSVWRCLLNRRDRIELEASLSAVIHHHHDQIILANLGPTHSRAQQALLTIGKDNQPPQDPILIF